MRRPFRNGLIGAAALATACAWPASASAATRVSGTSDYLCRNADYSNIVLIHDTWTRIYTPNATLPTHEIDVLTNTVTGRSITYVSNYTTTFDEFFSATSTGPNILDLSEPTGLEIYYLRGHAELTQAPGGYTASAGGDRVINVCAQLGVYP
ncbi:MAG: hypothetical protein ACJ74O_15095 [Frankiaceae bacterium]